MPMFIPMIAGYAAASFAVSAGIVVAGSIGATVIGGIASFAVGQMLNSSQGGSGGGGSELAAKQASGALVNTSFNIEPIPVVYGYRRKGGSRIVAETSANSQSSTGRLNMAIVFSEGEISEIGTIYLDDVASDNGRFAGYVILSRNVGTDDQAADPQLLSTLSGIWTANHRLRGVAYAAVTLEYNSTAFSSSLPNITADINGKLCIDPRLGSPTTAVFSHNPALVVRDYLTNARYGRGIPQAAVHDSSFSDCADFCEERIDVPTFGSPPAAFSATVTADTGEDELALASDDYIIKNGDGVRFTTTGTLPAPLALATTYYAIRRDARNILVATTQNNSLNGVEVDLTTAGTGTHTITHWDMQRYTCDGIVNPDEGTLQNIRSLLTSCRGSLVYSSGQYRLIIDRVTAASSFEFNEDNIVGGWQIKLPGKRDKVNRVKARFTNPDRAWQPDIVIVDSEAFRDDDNGILLEREISLPFTMNAYSAQHIAGIEMKQSRISIVCEFTAMSKGLRCEIGDVVPITHPTPGWDGKLFRIVNLRIMSNDEVGVTAVAYDDEVYDLDDLTLQDAIPSTNLPDPFDGLDIDDLTATSGTDDLFVNGDGTVVPRIHLRWTLPDNPSISYYELQFTRTSVSPTEWVDAVDVSPTQVEAYCHPVEDGVSYDVRIRASTTFGNTGAWSYIYAHTVVGKTEPPSDVTGQSVVQQSNLVIFDCDTVLDADLDAVEIRIAETASTAWADATPLANILRGQTATSAAVPPGTWTFLFKAKDTSGNYSANAVTATLAVTATGFTSLISSQQAPDWLGQSSNFVRHWTGVIFPDSQDAASVNSWSTFDSFVPNPYANCYYETPSLDKGMDGTARIWASIASVLGPGASGVANPRFQVDHHLAAGSYDGFESWTIGNATFRYVKGRIYVDTSLGLPVISSFLLNVDAGSRSEEFLNQAIDSAGTAITFATPFHSEPVIQMTPIGTTALIPSAENPTETGFIAHLYNTSGVGTAGNANITVTGA